MNQLIQEFWFFIPGSFPDFIHKKKSKTVIKVLF